MSREVATRDWYDAYYRGKGADRNDLRANRGVLFQTLAAEAAVVRACYAVGHNPAQAKVLDVGCGAAADLYQLLRLKYSSANVVGIDILAERIAEARSLYPQVRFVQGDASGMDFPDAAFDLVFESTMFATLPDDRLSRRIAQEMIRVCRPGGYLLLVDWWTPKPRDPAYKALTPKRLRQLFSVGSETQLVGTYRGALVPPVGRLLSRFLPSLYFVAARLFPFLVGQVVYLLQKPSGVARQESSASGQLSTRSHFTEEHQYVEASV
jgi:SAM-dependent methyltransferase